MRIYLADLGHNQVTISSDVYPLGVANLATFAQAYLKTKTPLEIRIFREPQDLRAALDATTPDVVGFSSYAWNHNLARSFARYVKRSTPNVLTLMGGPNYPLTAAEQESFLRGMPEIDVAVRGPNYEGERAFLNAMQRYEEVGHSVEGLREEAIPGSHWINPATGEFVRGADLARIMDLDEIPSPYLAGVMDPYFATGYFPLMQIARGCPFTCQFCNSSVKSNSKIFGHSLGNVCQDLLYVAERIRPEHPLCFADDNFGMYELDVEVADYIAYLQDRFNWPRYIRTTTGKNRSERIIEVIRKTRGALPMTSAVQSMNPEVLKNIQRSNIKLETYALIQKEVRAQGMQAYGEMILSLPGETKQSFMKGVSDLLDTGVTRISAHQLMLLHGAPLSDPDQRERFGFKTRFRVVARDVGNYTGEP
ncbi:MAG: B12-binding domain-containing radical SAM protein, partial [Gemmatimonadaceae bacterium]